MIGLIRNSFKNSFKNNRNFSNCKYDPPMFGPSFYSFLWGGLFTILIITRIRDDNYYLYRKIEDLKKEISDLKKNTK